MDHKGWKSRSNQLFGPHPTLRERKRKKRKLQKLMENDLILYREHKVEWRSPAPTNGHGIFIA
jgi:hypothetical protein